MSISPKVRTELIKINCNTCAYCGKKFEASKLEIDHYLPVSQGGTDDKENLRVSCRPCNAKKGSSIPEGAEIEVGVDRIESIDRLTKELSSSSHRVFGGEISANSENGFLSATDLVRHGNKLRVLKGAQPFSIQTFMRQKSTIDFRRSLEKAVGSVYVAARGRGQHTWVHPLLFIDIATAIDPKFKVEAYKWLYASIKNNQSKADRSYDEMVGALYANSTNKSTFPRYISEVARDIKQACGVRDWQAATEAQLKLRDTMHENIALIANVLRDNDRAVKFGMNEALKRQNEGI